jgi:protein-S-isoprenylcysteine O-methyltransferase Ste14
MTPSTFVLLADFVAIALLPAGFFRPGRLNLRWFLTALPLFVSGALLVAHALSAPDLEPRPGSTPWRELLATALALGSLCLMSFTLGTHRVPLALWHQHDDDPQAIVTWGAYRRVRHPFYSAFIAAQAACALLVPHPLSLAMLAYSLLALSFTARREERLLLSSRFGAQYRAYMAATGRFMPFVGRVR